MQGYRHRLFDENYYFKKISSTNTRANKLIKDGMATGNFLVAAAEQSGGLGRNKKGWESPLGGLWMTAGLYGLNVDSNLTLFTGNCVHKALCKMYPEIAENLTIKWPNDIFFDESKLCGILTTAVPAKKYPLLGIGVDTNILEFSEDLDEVATSLQLELEREVSNQDVASAIFDVFADELPEFIEKGLDSKYFNQHAFLADREIVLDTDFASYKGLYKGINSKGAILLELKPGMIQPFCAGSIVSY